MGRMMREYFIPLLKEFDFLQYLKHDQNVPDSDVTPEYWQAQLDHRLTSNSHRDNPARSR
jgi:hypothetical protein